MMTNSAIPTADPLIAQTRQRLASRLGDDWCAGDRLPAVRDLAVDLDVSHGTVQRAIKELSRNGFLVTRPRLGIFVSDDFSNAQLRAVFAQYAHASPSSNRPLAGKKVVICDNKIATHMQSAQQSLEASLVSQGCDIEHHPIDEMMSHGSLHIDMPDADALVLMNPATQWTIAHHSHQHLLILTSAATFPTPNRSDYDVVTLDQEQGAALAGQHLRKLGCETACYVGVGTHAKGHVPGYEASASPFLKTAEIRCRGFEQGWGASLQEHHKLYAGAYSPLSGAVIARQYAALKDRPRGVFLVCDDLATGFVNGLATLGLQLQRDYELVGFDGQQQFKNLSQGAAVSVEPDGRLMGMHAAQLLLDRVQNPDRPRRTMMIGCVIQTRG